MSDQNHSEPRAQLKALRAEYLRKLPERFQQLNRLVEAVPLEDPGPNRVATLNASLSLLAQEAHKLAGSAGTLGLAGVSTAARDLLSLAERWHEHPMDAASKKQRMSELVARMQASKDEPGTDAIELSTTGSRKIHIVDDDELVAQQMLTWLLEAGFDAEVYHSSSVYLDTFETLPSPQMILMDVAFGHDEAAGPDVIRQLRRRLGRMPAVVFLSVHDELAARLAALRAGASRYLVKPVSKTRILELAHEFAERRDMPRYRVMVVDDDKTALQFASIQLEQSGLEVHATSEPLKALDTARDIEPDVIILDIVMPGVSGTELAAILREDRRFDATPIVFLTTLSHQDEKTLSVALGGDDYILKPFDADYLTATVRSRAKRARRLRELLAQVSPD
ncbi:Hpt domain-containing protein [Marinobacter gudaonensis]|uniref:Hpt domain-containing protein n=1 Tax=Marinobacter gudaonensis TaxID=375760 RepID=A0A1I6H6K0_9GAMM|nr:response regulator [Marinobacter gudaonensis]SFR50000.1 Hpt domain-containing protein [Marinobacter gudaonensis]